MKIGLAHFDFKIPVIMGVLNVTPDSFSDGGKFTNVEDAVKHGLTMVKQGAGIIDIGGESTRPGAFSVDAATEIKRALPVVKALKKVSSIPISIDTNKAIVAKAALDEGADMINDISGLKSDPDMAKIAARYQVPIVLMHIQGTPHTMQNAPHYDNVIEEIIEFFTNSIELATANNIKKENIIVDPGIGFGKTLKHNLLILKNIDLLHKRLEVPILVGASRKSFLGKILDIESPQERLNGTIAVSAFLAMHKVHIIRVHDVKQNFEAVKTIAAIMNQG